MDPAKPQTNNRRTQQKEKSMRGAYTNYLAEKGESRYTSAVEKVMARAREDAELRLARIMNGAEPEYINGCPKDREKGRRVRMK